MDRILPRGVSLESAALDLWLKEIAPSTALRKWFDLDPSRFAAFQDRYRQELEENPRPVTQVATLAKKGDVVLLLCP